MIVATRISLPGARSAMLRGWYPDVGAVILLFALTIVTEWKLVTGGTVIGLDIVTQYDIWFSFLGRGLRSGHIPMWNPHSFSGTPFAADPLSGWAYLPAMLLFTLLPLAAAAKGYLLLHLLLAALGMYALARALGMRAAAALVAAVAYAYNGFFYIRHACCFPYSSVAAWLPLTLLGMELAIRTPRWLARSLWWGVAGLALSQILAAWLGQGAYYALLAIGGFVAYRTLLAPPETIRGVRARLMAFALHGGALLLVGFGLAAAGLLPRLEYNALSNLAGGYRSGAVGGWSVRKWSYLLKLRGIWYTGGATLVLAVLAPVVARRRFATPYWLALSLATLVLSLKSPTPLHRLLYHLPGFARIHPHGSERIAMLFYLGAALLAGAALDCLAERGRRAVLLTVLPVAAVFFLRSRHVVIYPKTLSVVIVTILLVSVLTLLRSQRRLVSGLLILVVFVDLFVSDRAMYGAHLRSFRKDRLQKVELNSYFDPSDAVRFLQSRQAGQPVRYFGYAPTRRNQRLPYTFRYYRSYRIALQVNNRAVMTGLQDVQGYNPIHLKRYDQYLAALNDRRQDYHDAEIFRAGLYSPLLDLLNARYIIVTARDPGDQEDLRRLIDTYPTVYSDSRVRVLENRAALPRAWLVHSARQVRRSDALELIDSGRVDARSTALLERPPPPLAQPAEPAADRTTVTYYSADRIDLRTATTAPGMLMLSEVYYPAWKAYVDRRETPIYAADHALRAVPVPPGTHRVELRYQSPALRVGVTISLVTYLSLAVLLAVAVGRRRGRWRYPSRDDHR